MFEKCLRCGKLSGQIQEPDEFSAIRAAKKGTLSACCLYCGYRWVLPAEDQAAWAAVEPG
jgi:hypothetical protein